MQEPPEKHYRANDIWLSAGMVAAILTSLASAFTISQTLTQGAIRAENRFTVLEEKLKSMSDDIQDLKKQYGTTSTNGRN